MITEWNTETAKRGDEITEEIYDHFLDALPPAYWRGGVFQMGEPQDTRLDLNKNTWRDTYLTFGKREGRFFFLGENFRGETESLLGISAYDAFNGDKQYLRITPYDTFWAVEFSSPSLGCTLKTGTKEEMQTEYFRFCSLSDEQFTATICK